MADNSWAYELPTLIYSLVKAKSESKIKKKYPKVKFTTSDKSSGNPIYPTVYIHELPASENSRDIEGKDIISLNFGMQVEVITDTSQSDARYIMNIVCEAFKGMDFRINQFPNFENGATYYRLIARCTRGISGGDSF